MRMLHVFMPWLCVDYMIQQGVWSIGFSYPDPLAIHTHWLGHKVVHFVACNKQKLKSCFHQYSIYLHKFNKTMAYKENRMVDRCMRIDSSHCDASRITLDVRSRVIRLQPYGFPLIYMYILTTLGHCSYSMIYSSTIIISL